MRICCKYREKKLIKRSFGCLNPSPLGRCRDGGALFTDLNPSLTTVAAKTGVSTDKTKIFDPTEMRRRAESCVNSHSINSKRQCRETSRGNPTEHIPNNINIYLSITRPLRAPLRTDSRSSARCSANGRKIVKIEMRRKRRSSLGILSRGMFTLSLPNLKSRRATVK